MTLEHNHSTEDEWSVGRNCAGCLHDATLDLEGVLTLHEVRLGSWLDTDPTDMEALLVLYVVRDLLTSAERMLGQLGAYVMEYRGLTDGDEPEDMLPPPF